MSALVLTEDIAAAFGVTRGTSWYSESRVWIVSDLLTYVNRNQHLDGFSEAPVISKVG